MSESTNVRLDFSSSPSQEESATPGTVVYPTGGSTAEERLAVELAEALATIEQLRSELEGSKEVTENLNNDVINTNEQVTVVEGTANEAIANADQAIVDAAAAQQDATDAITAANSAVTTAGEAQTAAAQAASDASDAQDSADAAALLANAAQADADQALLDAAAAVVLIDGKSNVLIQSTTPTSEYELASTLWIDTTLDANTPKRWNGSTWEVITDQAAIDAANAAAQAQADATTATNLANAAQEDADSAISLANTAQAQADTATTNAATAQAAATAAQSTADSAQADATLAIADALAAQGDADQALLDAASAAGIADSKADVLIQSTAPASAMQKSTTLWIDTSNGDNTPKRWNGSIWEIVTDKVATDAAAAAVAAQSTANTALQDASDAQDTADSAAADALLALNTANTASATASTADGRITVAASDPTVPDAAGKPIGAIWEVRSGSTVLRRYVLTATDTWTQVTIGQNYIGEDAIGSAQIADLAVGTAHIADASITNAKVGDLSVGKLTVTGGAEFPTVVVDTLMGQTAFLDGLNVSGVVTIGGTNYVTQAEIDASVSEGITNEIGAATSLVQESTSQEITDAVTNATAGWETTFATQESLDSQSDTFTTSLTAQAEEFTTQLGATQDSLNTRIDDIDAAQAAMQSYVIINHPDFPGILLGELGDPFKVHIDNDRLSFLDSGIEVAYISNQSLNITDASIKNRLSFGSANSPGYFDWEPRDNGNLSLKYRSAT